MKPPEGPWAGQNAADAVAPATFEAPVRLIEGTELIAKQLEELLGDQVLIAAGCLYWPMATITQPYPKNGRSEVHQVVKRINKSASYGLSYNVSFDAPEMPNVKPGEPAPIFLKLRSNAANELLLESGLVRFWLQEKNITSQPSSGLEINLTPDPVSYRSYLSAYRILQPHANKTKTLGPPTVAEIRTA